MHNIELRGRAVLLCCGVAVCGLLSLSCADSERSPTMTDPNDPAQWVAPNTPVTTMPDRTLPGRPGGEGLDEGDLASPGAGGSAGVLGSGGTFAGAAGSGGTLGGSGGLGGAPGDPLDDDAGLDDLEPSGGDAGFAGDDGFGADVDDEL